MSGLPRGNFSLDEAPVTFYVVRHGQTLFNIMGKVQGWCDTPLTDEGIRVAAELGASLAPLDFAVAFSSDSGRAVQTLEVALDARAVALGEAEVSPEPLAPEVIGHRDRGSSCVELPFPIARDCRLREWCYGDLEGEPGKLLHAALTVGFGEELSFEEHNRRLPEVADVLARADASGRAESFDVIEQRLRSFFYEAGEAVRRGGGGNVLVVTHSFVVRTLVYLIDPSRVNDPVKIANASITRIGYDGDGFVLGEIGSTAWQ